MSEADDCVTNRRPRLSQPTVCELCSHTASVVPLASSRTLDSSTKCSRRATSSLASGASLVGSEACRFRPYPHPMTTEGINGEEVRVC